SAIVQGDELAQLALPRSSSAASLEPRSKVSRASDVDLSGSGDEIAPAQYPRAPHPLDPGSLPVRFMTADLRPSPGAQDMVSFDGMEDAEEGDDAISMAASEREEWSNSPLEYTALHCSDARDLHHGDVELLRVLTKAVKELGLVWAPPAELTRSRLDEWYLQSDRGRKDTPRRPGPFFPEVHNEIAKSWNVASEPGSSLLSSVDGADRAGYAKLPPVEEAVAAHLCSAAVTNWRVRNNASLPSKPCRATANFAGKAFSAVGQAASALHVMAILQVYQAKLLKSLDEGGPDPEVFKELRRATDLALRTTKVMACAIGRSMGNLVVLDRHLWLTLTELKDSEKTALLDAPVDPSGLFGAAVETFTERFAEAQKQSRAISHFLPKRAGMNPPARSRSSSAQRAGRPHASSSASARPEQEPTVRPRQPDLAPAETAGLRRRRKTTSSTEDEPLKKSARSAVCVHHAPLPVAGSKNSCHVCFLTVPLCSAIKLKKMQNLPQYQSDFPPLTPLSPTTHTHVVLNSPLANGELSLTVCSSLSQFAEAWQMLPGVSEWVMKSIKNGYTLQFFRRPPRFNGVLMSTVREQNASILREEIHNLLGKCAVEKVPLADRESGFFSRYFLVPKKDGRLRPVLDLRPLNRALSKRPFKMITLKQILSHVRAKDWFISVDLKDVKDYKF
ncbi:hypothetical protein M9458_033247, partial [Cirrhinus mrigala]